MDEHSLQAARELLGAAQRVVVTSHIRPDGDAIGSLLGLGLSLRQAGKDVQMVLADGIPAVFHFLPGADQVTKKINGPYDVSIVVDCSEVERTGEIFPAGSLPDLNIDHHVTNLGFARLNLVDPQAVATAALLAEYLKALSLPLDAEVANLLLTGLLTDTLGFRTANMSAKALRLAADLVEAGADLHNIYFQAISRRSFEAARLWGLGLNNLHRQDSLVWTSLTWQERLSVGYQGRDDADLVNLLTTIDHTDIILVFLEQPNERVKISWRSRPGLDVSRLAVRFGGGGHRNAAGADVPGLLENVMPAVLEATRAALTESLT
jgi:phosphoesterase RecJ-like protein